MTFLPPDMIARRIGRAALAALPASVLLFTGCNLDVLTPDIVQPTSLQGAAALPTQLAGAVGDFALAYSGYADGNSGEGIALNSGLFADEFVAADFFSTHIEIDTRNLTVPNSSNTNVLRNLMRARTSAENTSAAYVAAGQPNVAGRARVLSLAGYVYTIVAENYCSGVPFSSVDASGNKVFGSPKSRDEMLATAIAKFDSAITVATAANSSQQLYLARIGKARALVDAGKFSVADTVVASVPVGFDFSTEHSTIADRTKNGLYDLTYLDTRYTLPDGEGLNGLAWVSANDPRVPTEDIGISQFDGATELFPTLKYSSYTSPTPIATGVEAKLIRAEAAYRGGNYPAALQGLNDLRLTVAGLAPLLPAATPSAQENQIFSERAYWLFGTAHRLGDLRRLVSQYSRSATSVFPTGPYFKGANYGSQLSLLVPQDEEQNPNFSRAACDPTKPDPTTP
jgi:hypothetical protein